MNQSGLIRGHMLLGPLTDRSAQKYLWTVTSARQGGVTAIALDTQDNLMEINLRTPKDMTDFGDWEFVRFNPQTKELETAEWPIPEPEGSAV